MPKSEWGQILCCKSVQLVRGSSFRSDFLQNPYFKYLHPLFYFAEFIHWYSSFPVVILSENYDSWRIPKWISELSGFPGLNSSIIPKQMVFFQDPISENISTKLWISVGELLSKMCTVQTRVREYSFLLFRSKITYVVILFTSLKF